MLSTVIEYFLFIFTQQWNTILQQIWTKQRQISCKPPAEVNLMHRILPFAEYLTSKSWPIGRVIKNSSGFHRECTIKNKSTLLYLGQTSAKAEQAMTTLKDQHTYMRLNKAF